MQNELHPALVGARIVRSMRALRNVRGFERVAARLVPPSLDQAFLVRNPTGMFAGNLSSFIERRMYLFGCYEEQLIEQFIGFVDQSRRRTILDIGANVGTHCLAFSQAFQNVHSFEPNAVLWPSFERNVALNGLDNVALHKMGLGTTAGKLPFYAIPNGNHGLSTVVPTEQYDQPLSSIGEVLIENGDQVVEATGIDHIDAIKIDVQGIEPEVVAGLQKTLIRHKPVVWIEVGNGTSMKMDRASELKQMFPFASNIYKFEQQRGLISSRCRLVRVDREALDTGDYLVTPAEV